jgi:hypothetical protein
MTLRCLTGLVARPLGVKADWVTPEKTSPTIVAIAATSLLVASPRRDFPRATCMIRLNTYVIFFSMVGIARRGRMSAGFSVEVMVARAHPS